MKHVTTQDIIDAQLEYDSKTNSRLTEAGMFSAVCYTAHKNGTSVERALKAYYPHIPPDFLKRMLEAFWIVADNRLDKYFHAGELMSRMCWLESGMQSLEMSHTLAAQLVATRVAPDCLDLLKMPWPSFCIRLPTGMFQMRQENGNLVTLTDVLLSKSDMQEANNSPPYVMCAVGEGPSQALCLNYSLSLLLKQNTLEDHTEQVAAHIAKNTGLGLDEVLGEDFDWGSYGPVYKPDAFNHRTMNAISNFVAATLAHLTDLSATAQPRDKKEKGDPVFGPRPKPAERPVRKNYKLVMPVVIDVKDHVRAYLRGEAKPPRAHTLVMGHYRNQPHGPGNSLRRLQYIKPFWRGPSDGHVPVRPHVIPDPKKEKP